jgi:uncharacterized protein
MRALRAGTFKEAELEKPLEILEQLQEADLRIDKIRQFIDHYPDFLKALDDEHAELKKRADEEKATLDSLKKDKAKKELDLKDGEDHIVKCNVRLNSVKTNKEYEATLKEIEDQKHKISDIETEILLLFDQVDQEEGKLKEARKKLDQEEKDIINKKKGLADKLERAKAALPNEEKKRAEIIPLLKPDALENYRWLQQRIGAKVLTRLVDETCQSCFRKVPSQMYNEVLAGNNLLTCPGCNRIMVYRVTEFLSQDKDFDF